jgi:hypothetical protein
MLPHIEHGQGDGAAGMLHIICDLGGPVTG